MTERKPPGISFASWVDQQITEAAERGAFDNLPGAGKPIPKSETSDDGQVWLRNYLRKEGVLAEDILPTPLKQRKQIERLNETVQGLGSEQEVREVVGELNRRIIDWRRVPIGPPIFVPLVDEKEMLRRWRDGRPATFPNSSPADVDQETKDTEPARPRWWRRIGPPRRH
jgi:Domain of unknown function (DUF1992)